MTRTVLIGAMALLLSMARAWAGDAKAEIDFVTRASTANILAVDESRLALDKAHDPNVKAFARRLFEDHRAAEAELRAAAIGSGATVAAMLDPERQRRVAALRAASGPAFDKAYLADQVAVHSNALTLYGDYMLWGDNPKLNALSVERIPITQKQLTDAVALAGD